jgi:cyclopropane-fatty-acyl-phospholipid synthase
MTIHDRRFFRRVATRGKVGLGESYTAGEWDSDDLVGFFELLLRNAAGAATRHPRVRRLLETRPRLNRRNGLLRARRNIAYHYDLGNDLFELMLDETMTYSCAVFERPDELLADAQRRKYQRICDKLQLASGDRVLEVGCGWGGFAAFAAREHGCSVTGLTILDYILVLDLLFIATFVFFQYARFVTKRPVPGPAGPPQSPAAAIEPEPK